LKKEYLTKKKLQADITALDALMKNAGKDLIAELEAKKAGYQKQLDKKILLADKKRLVKENAALQKKIGSIEVKTYSGIWKNTVTTADWEAKTASIQAKKDYFLNKLAGGGLSDTDKAKYAQFLKDLDEFNGEGKIYYETQTKLKEVQSLLTSLKKGGSVKNTLDDAFSKVRKEAALWAKTPEKADEARRLR
jgi:hypothetical protein